MPIDVTHLQTLLASEWKLRHILRYPYNWSLLYYYFILKLHARW